MSVSKAVAKAIARDAVQMEARNQKILTSNLLAARKKLMESPDKWQHHTFGDLLDETMAEYEAAVVEEFPIEETIRHGQKEGQLFAGMDMGAPKGSNFWGWSPVLPSNAIALAESEFANKIGDATSDFKTTALRTVQQGLAMGSGTQDMMDELLGVGLQGAKGKDGKFRKAVNRAEAISRTVSNDLINRGAMITYGQIDRISPELGLQKIWQTLSDNRTSERCLSLSGQKRELNEPFQAGDGWKGQNPPAHPYCRSRVTSRASNKNYSKDIDDRFAKMPPVTPPEPPSELLRDPLSQPLPTPKKAKKRDEGKAFAPDMKEVRRQELLIQKATKKVDSNQEEVDFWKQEIDSAKTKAEKAKTDKARASAEKSIAENQKALAGAESRLAEAKQELKILRDSLSKNEGDINKALKKAEEEKIKWEQSKHTAHLDFLTRGEETVSKVISGLEIQESERLAMFLEKSLEASSALSQWKEASSNGDKELASKLFQDHKRLFSEADAIFPKDVAKKMHSQLLKEIKATSGLAKGEAKQIVEALDFQGELKPSVKKWTQEFIEMSGKSNITKLKTITSLADSPRPYALPNKGLLNLGDEISKETLWHEMAHYLEDSKYAQASESFIRSKAVSARMESLNDIFGVKTEIFGRGEKAYRDKFYNAYVGKVYYQNETLLNTEALSMGIQEFDTPKKMIALYIKDPSHFNYTVGAFLDAN